jgi:hypothetical protein
MVDGCFQQQMTGIMGPGVRRDDESPHSGSAIEYFLALRPVPFGTWSHGDVSLGWQEVPIKV